MIFRKTDFKEALRIYGIAAGILIVFFGILLTINIFYSKKNAENLHNTVEQLLDEKQPGTWYISRNLKLNSTMQTSSQAFEMQNKKTGEKSYAVILRTPTFYGAFPAVFIYSKTKGTEFLGYTNVHGRVRKLLDQDKNSLLLNYWSERIPLIIETAQEKK